MDSPPPRRRGRFRDASGDACRGQSTALEYTLALAVASLVITGLFVTAGDFVTSQRTDVVRTELGVVGQQLAGDVVAADRLVEAGASTETVAVNASLPSTIAGAHYSVAVTHTGSEQWLNLSTSDPEVSVSVRLKTNTTVATGAVPGGDVSVVYDDPNLEVRG
ncbi:DUF7266 family protein [Halosimplex sp. J119]